MILDYDKIIRILCYEPDSGDLIWTRINALEPAGYENNGCRYIHIDGRSYPYWKIIALFLRIEMPRSVIYRDGNKLNTRRKNLKFICAA